MKLKCKKFWICALVLLASTANSRENIRPIEEPTNSVALSGLVELHDDIYSTDLNLNGEFAPCKCFSIYGDASYRFLSYQYDLMLHDQRHESLNLKVNGFNEPYIGVKFHPFPFWGIDLTWRFLPGNGSQDNRYQRLSIVPVGLYKFSPNLKLGMGIGYHTFIARDHFEPGNEVGIKASLAWRLGWNSVKNSGYEITHIFLYRWRISESRNLNMAEPYQHMNDKYRGFRMKTDATRYFKLLGKNIGLGLFYEINRGQIFGFETGHTIGFNSRILFH